MRLIDADVLKDNCKITGSFDNHFQCVDLITLGSVIDHQPTAYDVDAVVKQIEDHNKTIEKGNCPSDKPSGTCEDHKCCDDCYDDWLLRIVRNGGVK